MSAPAARERLEDLGGGWYGLDDEALDRLDLPTDRHGRIRPNAFTLWLRERFPDADGFELVHEPEHGRTRIRPWRLDDA